uniref:Uncharacterized protein n=1 Tax=Acrobeloides nanus TaxID=290746 RepID=A0A914D2E2_9BILA
MEFIHCATQWINSMSKYAPSKPCFDIFFIIEVHTFKDNLYMLCNSTFVASVWLMLMFVKDRYQALCSNLFKVIPTQHTPHWKVHLKLFIISLIALL